MLYRSIADLLLAEVSKIQGDMEEYNMRMDKAESIARNDYEKSENNVAGNYRERRTRSRFDLSFQT